MNHPVITDEERELITPVVTLSLMLNLKISFRTMDRNSVLAVEFSDRDHTYLESIKKASERLMSLAKDQVRDFREESLNLARHADDLNLSISDISARLEEFL